MADRRKSNVDERIASIETAVNSQGGILDRLKHIDSCVDSIKRTIWLATGFLTAVSLLANWLTRGL